MNILDKLTQEKAFTDLPKNVQESILKVAKPAIGIKANIAKEPLPLTASKFGGVPYIAKGEDVPRDEKNRPYLLLAQFNLAEIKEKVGQHPQLPKDGLLQFFIPIFTQNYGGMGEHVIIYADNINQDNFNESVINECREVFYGAKDFIEQQKRIDKIEIDVSDLDDSIKYGEKRNYIRTQKNDLINKIPFFEKYGDEPSCPFYDECELTFSAFLDKPNPEAIDMDYKLIREWLESIGEIGQSYVEKYTTEHKLMGYAGEFVQFDPRDILWGDESDVPDEHKKYADFGHVKRINMKSFFEMNSQYIKNADTGESYPLIVWGDVGKAFFFIDEEDLKNRLFTKMEYEIQCH